MVESTSAPLKRQASEASASLDKLAATLKNIRHTMDMSANYMPEAPSIIKNRGIAERGKRQNQRLIRDDALLQIMRTLYIVAKNDIVL